MEKIKRYPCVLTIAGSDSSGGAGIQADIKTISATGCYAASVTTVLTAQNTMGVQHVHAIPASIVSKQMESVLSDLEVNSIKIGMLFNKRIIDAVSSTLEKFKPKNIVIDPVMVSKSRCELLKSKTVQHLKKSLFFICTLITPNINEAEKLVRKSIKNGSEMELAAIAIGKQYKTNILIKGGHLNTKKSCDVLYSYRDSSCHWYESIRIHTKNTHGTGCTLSSAIASYLAQGYVLQEAVAAAKSYLTKSIRSGRSLRIGHGWGPVDHFYFQKRFTYDI